MIYTRTGSVCASMCDSSTRLSPLAVFQLVEDAVTELMGNLHIDGITAMREYNAMWVFVKNVIRIFHRPDWREPFELRSFISGHSAAKLQIDTEIVTAADNLPIAHSRLELCALDLQSGSIRKASTVGILPDAPVEKQLPDLRFSRFPKDGYVPLEAVTVRATNLDYCSHTNNIEYVRFLLNTYPSGQFGENEIEQIEIHYGHQTFEGDCLRISKRGSESSDFFQIDSDNGSAVECRIDWKIRHSDLSDGNCCHDDEHR